MEDELQTPPEESHRWYVRILDIFSVVAHLTDHQALGFQAVLVQCPEWVARVIRLVPADPDNQLLQ